MARSTSHSQWFILLLLLSALIGTSVACNWGARRRAWRQTPPVSATTTVQPGGASPATPVPTRTPAPAGADAVADAQGDEVEAALADLFNRCERSDPLDDLP